MVLLQFIREGFPFIFTIEKSTHSVSHSFVKGEFIYHNNQLPKGWHTTPASLLCPQLWTPHPLWLHSDIDVSSPTHCRSSSHIWIVPNPNAASPGADKAPLYPSWWQTTSASFKSHELSQMVPHVPLCSTSTRPEDGELVGLTKRTVAHMKV